MGAACCTDGSGNTVESIQMDALPSLLRSVSKAALDAPKKAQVESQFWVEVTSGSNKMELVLDTSYNPNHAVVGGIAHGAVMEYTWRCHDCGDMGLVLDTSYPSHAVIVGIARGPIQEYNADAKASARVEPMDYLLQVNQVSGDAKKMEAELKTSGPKRLLIAKPMTIAVTVGRPLGMDLTYAPAHDSLHVLDIGDGAVANWNYANVDKMIKRGDRIVEVNGFGGDSALMAKGIKHATGELRLVFARPMPFANVSHFDSDPTHEFIRCSSDGLFI